MHFTFGQVATILSMFAALVGTAVGIVKWVNGEIKAERLAREAATENLRGRIHKLANDTVGAMKDYATKERVDQLERIVMAARGLDRGGDE